MAVKSAVKSILKKPRAGPVADTRIDDVIRRELPAENDDDDSDDHADVAPLKAMKSPRGKYMNSESQSLFLCRYL